jgi:hypothetical protein
MRGKNSISEKLKFRNAKMGNFNRKDRRERKVKESKRKGKLGIVTTKDSKYAKK